jgi:DNA-binding SARP family transcriptional activator
MGLVAAGRRGLSHHVLCEALWPDSEGDAAYRALITTVYRLRRLLRQLEAVSFAGGRVGLNTSFCQVDSWDFEQRLDNTSAASERLQLVPLYTGALFGDAESPLVFDARDRLRRKFVRCVLQLVTQFERDGAHARASELLEQAIDSDSSCEELHCALISNLGRAGEMLAARSAYQRCRTALLRRYGATPSAVTERIYREACAPRPEQHVPTFGSATVALHVGA